MPNGALSLFGSGELYAPGAGWAPAGTGLCPSTDEQVPV